MESAPCTVAKPSPKPVPKVVVHKPPKKQGHVCEMLLQGPTVAVRHFLQFAQMTLKALFAK